MIYKDTGHASSKVVKQETGGQMRDQENDRCIHEPNVKLVFVFFSFSSERFVVAQLYSLEKQNLKYEPREQNSDIILQELGPEQLHLTCVRVKLLQRG